MATVSPHHPRQERSTFVPALLPSASFDREMCGLVVDCAPRVFAVVQVCDLGTDESDGWIAAWGTVHDDGRTHVMSVDGTMRMSLRSPDRALRIFGRRAGVTARLVWLAPSSAAALDREEAA